jgi:hypothetical protein
MKFNQNWSKPFRFRAGQDNPEMIKDWGCDRKNGIYVIRDEADKDTLYVGSAGEKDYAQGDRHIGVRLKEHMTGKSHRHEINEMVAKGDGFTVRWAESPNPKVAEEIAIIQLEPKFNRRNEWKEFDKFDDRAFVSEAKRLGMMDRDPYVEIGKHIMNVQEQQKLTQPQKADSPVRPWERSEAIAKPEQISRERF